MTAIESISCQNSAGAEKCLFEKVTNDQGVCLCVINKSPSRRSSRYAQPTLCKQTWIDSTIMLGPTTLPPEDCQVCVQERCLQVIGTGNCPPMLNYIIYAVTATMVAMLLIFFILSYCCLNKPELTYPTEDSARKTNTATSRRRDDDRKTKKTRRYRSKERNKSVEEGADVQMRYPSYEAQNYQPQQVIYPSQQMPSVQYQVSARPNLIARKSAETTTTGDVAFINPRETDTRNRSESPINIQSPRKSPRSPLFNSPR